MWLNWYFPFFWFPLFLPWLSRKTFVLLQDFYVSRLQCIHPTHHGFLSNACVLNLYICNSDFRTSWLVILGHVCKCQGIVRIQSKPRDSFPVFLEESYFWGKWLLAFFWRSFVYHTKALKIPSSPHGLPTNTHISYSLAYKNPFSRLVTHSCPQMQALTVQVGLWPVTVKLSSWDLFVTC